MSSNTFSESNLLFILHNIENTLNLVNYYQNQLSTQKFAEFNKLNAIKIIIKDIISKIDKVSCWKIN